jgi:peptide/nickel transport system permease protein
MINLFLKRFIWSVTSFLGIVLILFFILEKAQPKPEILFSKQESVRNFSKEYQLIQQEQFIKKHHLGLAAFYISVYPSKISLYVPSITFNGFDNRFHKQFTGFLIGNWGFSYTNNEAIQPKIGSVLKITLIIGSISLLLSFIFGVYLGLFLAQNQSNFWADFIRNTLYFFQLMPIYLLAFVCIYFLSNKDIFYLFPSYGMKNCDSTLCIFQHFNHLILPILCFVLSTLGYIARQTEIAALQIMQEEFVLNAKAIGFTERYIRFKFISPNIAFPLISIFCGLIPVFFGGSVIIENIFSIPGIGKLIFQSFLNRDIPMAWAISLLISVITVLSYLLADILFYLSDPRLRSNINKYATQW